MDDKWLAEFAEEFEVELRELRSFPNPKRRRAGKVFQIK
jgi:hypothetical protein